MSADQVDVVITGGGTGGHVYPGLAVAEVLTRRGWSVHWVGAEGRIEADLVPPAGIPLTLLPGRGMRRDRGMAALRSNAAAGLELVRAVYRAQRLLAALQPKAVLGVGGFASGPTALAAWTSRIPLVIAEQNRTPGVANRAMSRIAKTSAVSFPDTHLARSVVTGNPVGPQFFDVGKRYKSRMAPFRVLLFGGSGGSELLNEIAVDLEARWRQRDDIVLRHVVGSSQPRQLAGAPLPRSGYELIEFEHNMSEAMAAADVAVCRAGSGTCFELAASGLPAILVPSNNVTDDHQYSNATWLVEHGGALLVREEEASSQRIAADIDLLRSTSTRLRAMSDSLHELACPNAAADIAVLVERWMR